MKSNLLHAYAFNLKYAHKLVEDVPDDRMADQPAGLSNHPAWVIGHLANTCNFAGSLLGVENAGPSGWRDLLGNGSKPVADRSKYPEKAALLSALEAGHGRVAEVYEQAGEAALDAATPQEHFRAMFPTVGDALAFIMVAHEGIHLGQLSAWRRAMGMGSVL